MNIHGLFGKNRLCHCVGADFKQAFACQFRQLLRSESTAGRTALGPLTAVAALAGLAGLVRARWAELAVAAAVAGAIGVDLRAAAVGPATLGLAALLAGLAIGRLAAMIRLASGQAITGATIGALALAPPAWTALAQRTPAPARAPAPHSGQASR